MNQTGLLIMVLHFIQWRDFTMDELIFPFS